MVQSQIGKYQDLTVTTARKEMLILLAYEGAMRFVNQARINIEKGDIAGKCSRISKAAAVIEELDLSLNMEAGGEIAENLHDLYSYMMNRLFWANVNSDPAILEEVMSLLKTLYEGWTEAIAKLDAVVAEKKTAAPAPAAFRLAQSY